MVSFERLRGKPKGRAVGGSGGAGGDVALEADPGVSTLLRYQRDPHHAAGSGTHGQGDLRHGKRGRDLVLGVPLGTTVRDSTGELLADLVLPGQRVVVLRGGRGGRGNAAFVGPTHRAPAFCEQGEYGPAAWFALELKLLADAALIGFPNAGKSTLISAVSAARPKIADYPFTTVQPHLGVVAVDNREFVMADIPGLIEGAAEGKGLGHEFLRHVERARALVVLLDPSPLQEANVEEQYRVLLEELRSHSAELVERPRVVAVNKADLPESSAAAEALRAAVDERAVYEISAVTGDGVPELLHAVADAVEQAAREAPTREGFILHRPVESAFTIARDGAGWVVEGREARRAVALADLTAPGAADFAARRLAALGVDQALRTAGARPGDEVRIGDLVFEFDEIEEAAGEPDSEEE